MSIRKRAFGLFLSILLLLVSSLTILFFILEESRASIAFFLDSCDDLSEIHGIKAAVAEEASSLGLYLLGSGDIAEIESAGDKTRMALEGWRRSMHRERTSAERIDTETAARSEDILLAKYETILNSYQAFEETIRRIVSLAEAGETETAIAFYDEAMSDAGSYGRLVRGLLGEAVEEKRAGILDTYEAIADKHLALRNVGTGLVVCAAVVMLLTYGLIGRKVLASLKKLERGAREYRRGDFPYVMERKDEIGSLSRAIDYMTRQINKNSFRLEYVENRIGIILRVVDRIAQGQYDTLCGESGGQDIFDRLSRGINAMIRELLAAKARTEEQRDRLDLTLGSIREGIISTNRAGMVTNMNEAAELLTGWAKEDGVGTELRWVLRIAHIETALPAAIPSLKCPDGGKAAVEGGGRFKLTTKTGESMAIEANWAPIKDSSNRRGGVIIVFRDITKILQNKYEVEQLQSKILRQEKLSSIGLLAAGIAHEINNPIGFIESNFRSLETYCGKIETAVRHADLGAKEASAINPLIGEIREMISDNKSGIDKISRIVAGMSAFSRTKDGTEPVLSDLNALVEETVAVADIETRYSANVLLDLNGIPAVKCLPGKVNQVLLNVLLNASAAIENGKKRAESGEKGTIRIATSFDGRDVICRISDDGPGMKKEDLPRVFDPFFTTKEPGEGTGLGLHVSYRIMKEHGGEITAENAPGSGAVFTLRFPGG